MTESASQSSFTLDAPREEGEVHCPLCGYNLRGLTEARCPECGGKFDRDELRDPTRRLHPYLFEHHPEQNVRSLLCTLLAGLLPRRFWRTLLPVQPSRPRRLILYWLLSLMLATSGTLAEFSAYAWSLYTQNTAGRVGDAAYYNGPGERTPTGRTFRASAQEIRNVTDRFGTVQNYLDITYPLPPSLRFFQAAAGFGDKRLANWNRGNGHDEILASNWCGLLIAAIWPWAATAIMLLFRASMRKAAVRPIHQLRVSIYCGDVIFWVGLVWTAFVIATLIGERLHLAAFTGRALQDVETNMLYIVPGLAFLLLTYRLGSAIAKYLRFRHAMAMAISVQIIFVLLVLKVIFWSTYG